MTLSAQHSALGVAAECAWQISTSCQGRRPFLLIGVQKNLLNTRLLITHLLRRLYQPMRKNETTWMHVCALGIWQGAAPARSWAGSCPLVHAGQAGSQGKAGACQVAPGPAAQTP